MESQGSPTEQTALLLSLSNQTPGNPLCDNHKSSDHHLLCGHIDRRKCVPNDDSFEREGREKSKDVPSKAWKLWFLKTAMILLFFLYVRRTFASGFFAFSQAVSVSLRSHPWWKVNDHIYAG